MNSISNSKAFALTLFGLFVTLNCIAKETIVSVVKGEVLVNSISRANFAIGSGADTRAIVPISLPRGTLSYAISVYTNKGPSPAAHDFLNAVSNVPNAAVQFTAAVAKCGVQGDGSAVDIFILPSKHSADAFKNKEAGQWRTCNLFKNTSSICRSVDGCLSSELYIAFRNNNYAQGLYVRYEVIALVSDNAGQGFSPVANYNIQTGKSVGSWSPAFTNAIVKGIADNLSETVSNPREIAGCTAVKLSVKYSEADLQAMPAKQSEKMVTDILLSCLTETGSIDELIEHDLALISSFIDSKDYVQAIGVCENLIKYNLGDSDLYNNYGFVLLLTKQFSKAKAALAKGMDLAPDNLYLVGNFAHALLLTGDISSANQLYLKYKDESIDAETSWKDMVKEDFKTFSEHGINNANFTEVKVALGIK